MKKQVKLIQDLKTVLKFHLKAMDIHFHEF